MAPIPILCLGGLVSLTVSTFAFSDQSLEIDGGSGMMRRSVPPPHLTATPANFEDSERSASNGLLETFISLGAEEKEPLGTMLLLVDSDDKGEMQNLEEILVPSLLSSLKFRTPVTVLFSGAKDPVEDATIKLNLNPSITLSLVDVTVRVDQFAHQHAPKHPARGQKAFGKIRKMNEFAAMHVHLLPELQHFHYALRLSPKSSFMGDVTTDLYEIMRKQKAILGYRLLRQDGLQACAGLPDAAKSFYKENAEYEPQTLGAKAFLQMYEQAECPMWTPDFQLVDLDYLRNNDAYGRYVKYIANKGGFAEHGWGVHSVQTLFLATHEEPERLLCMTPWVPNYHGESKTSCGFGLGLINFFQSSVKTNLDRAEKEMLQLKDVSPHSAQPPVESTKARKVTQEHRDPLKNAGMWARLASRNILFSLFGLLVILGGSFVYKKSRWGSRAAESASVL